MHSNKVSVQILANILEEKGVCNLVFSPGSRNAPLVIEFCGRSFFQKCSMPDERSAAFFALGQAQWTQKPSVICCTSGTASLNYAPAIAEAYYQGIPLLIVTADRPREWIDHGEGQSIRQQNIYSNYIKGSYDLPQEINNQDQNWYCNRLINEAVNLSLSRKPGPVHINVPFSEPLYNTIETNSKKTTRIIHRHQSEWGLSNEDTQDLLQLWNQGKQKMILCGLLPHQDGLNAHLESLAGNGDVAVLIENTSNLSSQHFNPCIDRSLAAIENSQLPKYLPDLLITIGGAIVSKKIKALFRQHPPKEHWHIGIGEHTQDMFQNLTRDIQMSPVEFVKLLLGNQQDISSGFGHQWNGLYHLSAEKHQEYLANVSFSDLKAYELVLDSIPENRHIHMANSTAVRYVQLFNTIKQCAYFCNRGVSGIDGSTSTALGSTYASGKETVLLTGDLSFFYDSNAFWNCPAKENLKVVIFNNSGGGIFRIIEGPKGTDQLEDFFETRHDLSAKHIAELYGLPYHSASSLKELEEVLPSFFNPNKHKNAILEIFTDPEKNPKALKSYFDYIKY